MYESVPIFSKKAAVACNDDGEIGFIAQVVANEKISGGAPGEGVTNAEYHKSTEFYRVVQKGERTYIYHSPQQACADTSTDEGMAAATVAEEAYRAFRSPRATLSSEVDW